MSKETSMYGTIGRMKIKSGQFAEMDKAMAEISGDRSATGGVAMFAFRMDSDPDEIFVIAISEDKEKYHAYAESEESHAGYEVMMRYLEEPPEWHDGEVISHKIYQKIK